MLMRLYRQRRRFLLGTVFTLLAGILVVFVGPTDGTGLDAASPITWIAVLLAALIVMVPLTLLWTYVLPEVRNAPEVVLLSLAAAAALNFVLPGPGPQGYWEFLMFVCLFVLSERLLYGTIADPVTRRPVRARRRTISTRAAPAEVWARLVPLPETAGTYFYPGTQITPVAGEADTYLLVSPERNGQVCQIEHLHVEIAEAPHRFQARFEPVTPGPASAGLAGRMAVEIAPRADGGSDVVISEARDPAPLRRRLQWFWDDEFADRTDSMIARLERRRDWSIFSRQFIKV